MKACPLKHSSIKSQPMKTNCNILLLFFLSQSPNIFVYRIYHETCAMVKKIYYKIFTSWNYLHKITIKCVQNVMYPRSLSQCMWRTERLTIWFIVLNSTYLIHVLTFHTAQLYVYIVYITKLHSSASILTFPKHLYTNNFTSIMQLTTFKQEYLLF